jgi:hypothetical protein
VIGLLYFSVEEEARDSPAARDAGEANPARFTGAS